MRSIMALPAAVTSHHTAWVTPPGGKPHPVRYAVDGERLVCFGDDALAGVVDRARVSVSIHEIAGGHLLAEFGASLRRLAPDAVAMNALMELLDHVPLGRTLEDVQLRLADQRDHRRIVELAP
jgi:hypothetical protein